MRFLKTLSAAVLTVVAVNSAQAQIAINPVNFTGTVFSTTVAGVPGFYSTGNGGGFTFNAPNAPIGTFTDYVAFCIDPTRSFSPTGSYTNYTLYTFGQFVNLGLSPNQVDENDLMYIASQVESYSGTASAASNATQKNIWDVFTGVVANAPVTMETDFTWGVLANGQNQTFLVKTSASPSIVNVPEPATFALMGFGLMGLAVVARRRNANR